MAVEYLKKTKLYELAKTLMPDIPSMRNCEYRFYRGSEWLKWLSGEECEDGWIDYKSKQQHNHRRYNTKRK